MQNQLTHLYNLLKINIQELQSIGTHKPPSLIAKNKPSLLNQRLKKNHMTASSTSTKSSANYESQTILQPLHSPKLRHMNSIHKIVKTKPLGFLSPRNLKPSTLQKQESKPNLATDKKNESEEIESLLEPSLIKWKEEQCLKNNSENEKVENQKGKKGNFKVLVKKAKLKLAERKSNSSHKIEFR